MSEPVEIQFFESAPTISYAEVFELIDVVSGNLQQIQRQTLVETGLTPPQYQVLHLLWQEDGRPFKDLAEACRCTRATITGLVDTLESKDLIERRPNPDDRRSILATLTEKGHNLQDETPSLDVVFSNCCSGLDENELRQLYLLLQKLNASLSC